MTDKVRKRSPLWNYFRVVDDTYVTCDICSNKLSYRNSTTNLRKHLLRKHSIHPGTVSDANARTIIVKESAKRQRTCTPKERGSNHLFNITTNERGEEPEYQASVSAVLSNFDQSLFSSSDSSVPTNRYTKDNQTCQTTKVKVNASNSKLMSVFIKDYQPYSIVEDKGFQEFVHFLNPSFELPTQSFISDVAIPELYHKCLQNTKKLIKTADIFCVTLEMWTSSESDNVLALTTHFLDNNFSLNSILLDCLTIVSDQFSENFIHEIKRVTTEWEIEEKIQFVVSEGNNDMQVAVSDILGYEHFNCFVESLNNVVRFALQDEDVLNVIEKVSASVKYFKQNLDLSKHNSKFTKTVSTELKRCLTQVSDSKCIRSLYNMLDNYTKMESIVKAAGKKIEDSCVLENDEWTIAAELCEVLKPFDSVMKTFGSERYCPASLVVPIVSGLVRVCSNLLKKPFSVPIKSTIHLLEEIVKDNLGNVESSPTLSVCTYLDPRFKTLAFTSKASANQAKETILSAMLTLSNEKTSTGDDNEKDEFTVWHVLDQAVAETRDTSQKNSDDDDLSVWSTFDNAVSSTKPKVDANTRALAEIQRYLDADMLPRQHSPLKWWLTNKHLYPQLATLARSQLCAVSNSIPCDRNFRNSTSRVNERRSKLSIDDAKMLVFLNSNYNLF